VIQEDALLDNASKVGDVLMNGLRDLQERHRSIREVRGLALMIGIEFPDHEASAAIEHRAFEKGLLMLGCGDDAIRISPALTFREDQARTALEAFEQVVSEVESGT
jgi:4-aminobutyrate aminotransferase